MNLKVGHYLYQIHFTTKI